MKIGVIIDDGKIAQWQARALTQSGERDSFVIYSCRNTRHRRSPLRHLLYYCLNLLALRTAETRRGPPPPSLTIDEAFEFDAQYDGAWQTLPEGFLDRVRSDRPEVILKFGMGLLRVPPRDELPIPILSYHHGDPREFRGRPAGFYELLSGRPVVGQIIQLLSNELDAGQVMAFAETKAHAHSYRATMRESYRASPYLLKAALERVASGAGLPMEPSGRNCRLPSNWTVAMFVWAMVARLIRRIGYGAIVEKSWMVAEAPMPGGGIEELSSRFPRQNSWSPVPTPKGYRFIADPFYAPEGGGLLAEGLKCSDELGAIVWIDETQFVQLTTYGGHYSYPSTISVDGRHYVVPEMCEWSPPHIFEWKDGKLRGAGRLQVAGDPGLIDPTLFEHERRLYLFGNRLDEGESVLRLWASTSLHDCFEEHPASPILISPRGGRMGGAIVRENGQLYRIGQDNSGGYGRGAILFRVVGLSPARYQEEQVGLIGLEGVNGPHTINFRNGTVLFDYFVDRFSPFAGIRRVQRKFSSRRISAARPE